MLPSSERKKAFLKNMANDPRYAELVEETKALYKKSCSDDIKALKYSDFKIFYETGSRDEYEKHYFSRRGKLLASAHMAMLFDDEEYLKYLEDILWAIMDEYTWVLPAHLWDFDNIEIHHIDLFAAETGFAFSEIYYLLSDRLSDLIKKRMKLELEKRIFQPFLTKKFYWEEIENNWAAVCAGSVGSSFMYMKPEIFLEIEPRIEKAMDSFLKSFEDDGVCREGYGYWNYGYGYFVYYAQLLREFTNGAKDYFELEKIKTIADFQQIVFLQGNVIASFSDGVINGHFFVGLSHFLKKEYDILIPDMKYSSSHLNKTGDTCYRFASYLRNLLWFDPVFKDNNVDKNYYYLKESGWYINKMEKYSFAIKAGHNNEPHNHNDIGSFIIAYNNEQLLCDLGMGEYTHQYFQDQYRYTFLCNSSLGHNLPVINGCQQSAGAEFNGEIINSDRNKVEIEFGKAYNTENLVSAKRKCEFFENSIKLFDEYEFCNEKNTVIERFISKFRPEILDDCINVNGMKVRYNKEELIPEIKEEIFRNHSCQDEKVYLIDFEVLNKGEKIKTEFEFIF